MDWLLDLSSACLTLSNNYKDKWIMNHYCSLILLKMRNYSQWVILGLASSNLTVNYDHSITLFPLYFLSTLTYYSTIINSFSAKIFILTYDKGDDMITEVQNRCFGTFHKNIAVFGVLEWHRLIARKGHLPSPTNFVATKRCPGKLVPLALPIRSQTWKCEDSQPECIFSNRAKKRF